MPIEDAPPPPPQQNQMQLTDF